MFSVFGQYSFFLNSSLKRTEMYIFKNLVKEANDSLYRDELPKNNQLKNYLPLSIDTQLRSFRILSDIWGNSISPIRFLLDDIIELKETGKIKTPRAKFTQDVLVKFMFIEAALKPVNFSYSETTLEVMNILKGIDTQSCLVGGAVRDIILGKTPKDFDFVSALPYDYLISYFSEQGFTIKECGKKFLVFKIAKNGETFEIANFRQDGTYVDGRRPENVQIGNILTDSARRDFTVGALYFNLEHFKLLDPTGMGIEDIRSKTLRFVGKPKDRLEEDTLRGIRFYRFIQKGLEPDKKSLSAVREYFADIMERTDPERFRTELERIVGII